MAYITAEEARNLTSTKRKRLEEHIYSQIEKFAKSGRVEVGVALDWNSYDIGEEEIELLIKELTIDGFTVKRTDGIQGGIHITISW